MKPITRVNDTATPIMLYARENALTHEHGIAGQLPVIPRAKKSSKVGMEQKHPHLTQRTGGGELARTDTHPFAQLEPAPGQLCQTQGFAAGRGSHPVDCSVLIHDAPKRP
jgi:hypothetical protein